MITRKNKEILILDAMNKGVEKAAERHRRMGVPMVIRKDGKTVEIIPRKKTISSRSSK
jgi:NCAIR mutase (PurE)-related protein